MESIILCVDVGAEMLSPWDARKGAASPDRLTVVQTALRSYIKTKAALGGRGVNGEGALSGGFARGNGGGGGHRFGLVALADVAEPILAPTSDAARAIASLDRLGEVFVALFFVSSSTFHFSSSSEPRPARRALRFLLLGVFFFMVGAHRWGGRPAPVLAGVGRSPRPIIICSSSFEQRVSTERRRARCAARGGIARGGGARGVRRGTAPTCRRRATVTVVRALTLPHALSTER